MAAKETELACIVRDEQATLAELGLTLAEAKQVTAMLQVQLVPAQMTALSACSQACAACERRFAVEGRDRATFRSLFGDMQMQVRRWFVCLCQGASEAKFDAGLGTPGLHHVEGQVEWRPRASVLPPDLFERFANDSFWRKPQPRLAHVPAILWCGGS